MILTVLAAIAFVVIGLVLAYVLVGDTFGLVDLDRIFPSRLALILTLFPLGMFEFFLWDVLFA